ncbi:hypothetical protein [Sphingomonas sp.]|uniref:hypothetical protein n=1 Tax=Sphingomonas sp. TaxID=28214 RepID=UPI0031DA05C3
MAALGSATPAWAQIAVGIHVNLAPPPLPVYVQPPVPGPDYIWTPGYWAWDDIANAYYWVQGAWMLAPRPGLLWTPPWWGWQGGVYVFHSGYWGPHVGFYGGVPYGFGYTGFGFQGGYWRGGHFAYNSTVTNITNVHVTNIYRQNVVVNHVTRISYNGGPGGLAVRPTPQEVMAAHEAHVMPNGRPMAPMAPIAGFHGNPHGFGVPNGRAGPVPMSLARMNPVAPHVAGGPPMVADTPMPIVYRGHGAAGHVPPAPVGAAPPVAFAARQGAWRGPAPSPGARPSWSYHARSIQPPQARNWSGAPYGPPRMAFHPAPPPRPAPHPPHEDHHPKH